MNRDQKAAVIDEVADQIGSAGAIFAVDYRGLSVKQAADLRARLIEIDALRGELLKHGARFSVVKNTLTRRAAEAAGAEALLALLEGPSAIAFLEADGDPVAAAKGRYIRQITVTSTMGPGIHVDPARTRGIAEELEGATVPA